MFKYFRGFFSRDLSIDLGKHADLCESPALC